MFKFIRNWRATRRSGLVCLLDVRDYPKKWYTVYWDIHINEKNLIWTVTFYDRESNKVVLTHFDQAEKDMNEARTQSQKYVKKHIEDFRRLRS